GGKNDLQVSGNYTAGTQDQVDMTVDIRNLAMATLEPFTMRQVSQMSGDLKGQVKITGSTSKPALNGVLQFQKVKMRPAAIGTFLTMNNEKIAFEGNKIRLDNFTMADSLNNKAVLNGFADISDLKQIAFDMTLTTRNFLALNNPVQKKETVHGTVLLDSDIHLTGSQQQPVVNMKVRLNKGTNVTFVNTSREAGMVEHEGIVVFTDSISRQHPIMTREDSAKKVKNKITEMDLKAQVEFDKDATLKMMVDPVAGDSLFVRGSGNIQFTLDPSGTMSLTGKYTIKEGGYHLTVSGLLKRDFRIREGSSIAWNSDIMDAETDITALYDVETSPLILLEDQLSGASDQQKNKYRNTLKFDVVLSMAGALMKPEIHFDIELQEKDRGAMGGAVYSKLAELREDESQLNKQVFALLTLGRFLGQDPLESGNGPITVSSAARSSASKLMTDQLNSLSAKYVKGVDLDVGVKSYEDYSSGQAQGRTQLQLGISKQMLQGRLNVRVGSNIDVEGEKATQNNLSDIAGDLSAEYKLTDDGRFRLKGFRQTEYENPIEGELVKTGIGFIYTRDFNKIREIYKKQENAVPLEDKKKKKDEIR
ncbi:MAG: translocation/assembly module TamB domain-containing protein, partial [Syntrophothermus sp.]